jgi:hypothetical protein
MQGMQHKHWLQQQQVKAAALHHHHHWLQHQQQHQQVKAGPLHELKLQLKLSQFRLYSGVPNQEVKAAAQQQVKPYA